MVNDTVIARDLKHIWHPCTQMKDFDIEAPFVVERAEGSYLYTDKGPLIDANSSWWCKSLGHQHPAIISAIQRQLQSFEHVIAANSTHPLLAKLGETLSELTGLQHLFFASDGSCAVEIAMKLAIHANVLKGKTDKNQFIALSNAYHGETLATLAVSDLGIYKAAYQSLSLDCYFIPDLPYVENTADPLWTDAFDAWQRIEPKLNALAERCAAVIVEPIVQGAGGMKIYSADFLKRLANWAKNNDIYLIADEIMTGMGRTGSWLASSHADCKPDMICLSKGLTSGTLPFSVVMLDHPIYQLFYNDYETGKSFLHSHTYSGHALGIAAALATIETMKNEQTFEHVAKLSTVMRQSFDYLSYKTGVLSNVRHIGAVIAAELVLDSNKRAGFQVYRQALRQGAFLRPLGNTLYWMPPLNTELSTIGKLTEITLKSIEEVKNGLTHAR